MCEICKRNIVHDSRCPNYKPPKAKYYCFYCGEGIFPGEEYIENLNGDYCHYDCINGVRDLLEWLGFEIETMEDV